MIRSEGSCPIRHRPGESPWTHHEGSLLFAPCSCPGDSVGSGEFLQDRPSGSFQPRQDDPRFCRCWPLRQAGMSPRKRGRCCDARQMPATASGRGRSGSLSPNPSGFRTSVLLLVVPVTLRLAERGYRIACWPQAKCTPASTRY